MSSRHYVRDALLCLVMFFSGPWAVILLFVCVGIANEVNRGTKVLWDRVLVPMLLWVLDNAANVVRRISA